MSHRRSFFLCVASSLALALGTQAASAKDSLGVFSDWGAFRDAETPRCYAIAEAKKIGRARQFVPFASIGNWPDEDIRSQIHFRLSRRTGSSGNISLVVGATRFTMRGGGGDAWAQDGRMDAAIIAAMRSASAMTISASDANGSRFTDRYSLEGVATAMDAATVGCSQL